MVEESGRDHLAGAAGPGAHQRHASLRWEEIVEHGPSLFSFVLFWARGRDLVKNENSVASDVATSFRAGVSFGADGTVAVSEMDIFASIYEM
jgi:hypothetical protein